MYWSQPEILLYDPTPSIRMSYPDLVEQDGRYWVTETQKTAARVHEIDKTLLEGLWNQGRDKTVARRGLVFDLDREQIRAGSAKLPDKLDLRQTGGLTLDAWLKLDDMAAGQVVLDNRDAAGNGFALTTAADGALRIELTTGRDCPNFRPSENGTVPLCRGKVSERPCPFHRRLWAMVALTHRGTATPACSAAASCTTSSASSTPGRESSAL